MHSGHTQKLILPLVLLLCCGSFAQSPIGGYLVPIKNTFGSTIYRGQIVTGDSTNSTLVQPYWAKDASVVSNDSVLGKAITGTSTGADYVDCGNSTDFDFIDSLSWECWYNTIAYSPGWMSGSKEAGASQVFMGIYLTFLYCGTFPDITPNYYAPPRDGNWHLIDMTWDGVKYRVYIDGSPADSVAHAGPRTVTTPGVWVAKRNDGFDGFDGSIDEFIFSKRVFNQDTITAHYRLGHGKYLFRGIGVSGLYHFDEGAGTACADSSGNGNNGTFVGSPTWTTGKVYIQTGGTSGGKVLYAIGTVYNDSIPNGAYGFMTTAGAGYVAVKKNKTESVKPGKRNLITSDSVGLADCEVPTGTSEDFREIGHPLTILFAVNAHGDSICIADIYKN